MAVWTCQAALVSEPFVLALVAEDQVSLRIHDGRGMLGCEAEACRGERLSMAKTKIESELCVALHMQCAVVQCLLIRHFSPNRSNAFS